MEFYIMSIIIIAVFIGFFVNMVFGFAGNFLALPILLLVLSLQDAISLLAILLLFFSCVTTFKYWKDMNKRIILELAIGSIIGLIIGVYVLKFGNPVLLKKGLGLLIFAYVLHAHTKKQKVKFFENLGLVFGFLGGFFGGLYNASGPVLVTYITSKLDKASIIRATTLGSLGVVHFIRVPTLFYGGLLTFDIFIKSIIVLPFCLLSLYLAHKFHGKLQEDTYKNIMMGLLLISAVLLIVK